MNPEDRPTVRAVAEAVRLVADARERAADPALRYAVIQAEFWTREALTYGYADAPIIVNVDPRTEADFVEITNICRALVVAASDPVDGSCLS